MTTVPSWIAKAVIVEPGRYTDDTVTPIVEWRATRTQVIVRTSPTGPERRFRLDGLIEIGDPNYFRENRTRLEPPDAPVVIAAQQAAIVNNARATVMRVIEKQRLQDSGVTPEDVARKLSAIRDAATDALAQLAEVL